MKIINLSVVCLILAAVMHLVVGSPIFQDVIAERAKRASINRNCEDFRANSWVSWGPCYKVMGKYIQSRWRTRQVPYSYSGQKCPKEWDEKLCDPLDVENVPGRETDPRKRRCDLTEWTNWSECYFYMKTMERERHRSPFFSKGGKLKCSEVQASVLVEYEECRNDCGWTPWTPCYKYGTQREPRWERYRENKSMMHRYMLCPGRWVEFQDCEYCEWTGWGQWSSCYEFSSNYERKRERARVVSNSRRGTKCTQMSENEAEDYGPCPLEEYYDLVSAKRRVPTTSSPNSQVQMYTPAATYSFGSKQLR